MSGSRDVKTVTTLGRQCQNRDMKPCQRCKTVLNRDGIAIAEQAIKQGKFVTLTRGRYLHSQPCAGYANGVCATAFGSTQPSAAGAL